MRIDLTDTTFIIPVRIDSMIRLENLLMSVDSIVRYFRTRILILEASSYQNEIIPSLIKDDTVKYTFLVDKDPVFYKTKYLNILAKQVDTPLVCIWDADVILDHLQILDAVKQLRTRTSDVAYPYDGNLSSLCAFVTHPDSLSWRKEIQKYGGLVPLQLMLPVSHKIIYTDFSGLSLPIPENFAEFLECRYGHEYMIPDPTFVYPKMGSQPHKYRYDKLGVVYEC